jgi:hypothetical protein
VHTDIQLLPQQAGMASILATAVINSKYVTPRGRLWLTLKSKVRADPGGGGGQHAKGPVYTHGEGGAGDKLCSSKTLN